MHEAVRILARLTAVLFAALPLSATAGDYLGELSWP